MAQEGPKRANQDSNGAPAPSLLLWAGLIVASALLIIMWVAPFFSKELAAGDLLRLIRANQHESKGGPLAEGALGYVDVQTSDTTKPRHFRFSKLRQVVVRERTITGQVDVV